MKAAVCRRSRARIGGTPDGPESAEHHDRTPLPAPTDKICPFFRGCGLKRACFIAFRVSCTIRKRPFSNDLRFWCRNGPCPPLPQPEDTPVSSRLGLKRGMRRRDLRFSCNRETAEFQRFGILMSEWSAFDPAPTGKIRPFLALGAKKGCLFLVFCAIIKEAIPDSYQKDVCADFWPVVRILNKACGFSEGCADSSWGFSAGLV